MAVLRRRSLAVKLPLGIALLLAIACAALTLTAYLQVRRSAFDLASTRLSSAARQVAALVEPGIRARGQTVQRLANDVAIRAYLADPTPQTEADVLADLARQTTAASRTGWQITDPAGQPLLSTPGWISQPSDGSPLVSPGVGQFRRSTDNTLFYDVSAAALEEDRPLGYLVERRSVSVRSASVTLLGRLIGDDAQLALGNASGDVWSDFSQPIAPLPAHIVAQLVTVTPPGGAPVVARGEAIPGTPWTAAVLLPRAQVLAPVRAFVTQALTITLVVILVGAAAGWVFSRRITQPLRRVTESAVRMAGGDGAPATRPRGDEVARLDASFAAMAARVDDSRQKLAALVGELEQRVQARTAALTAANTELEAFNYSVSHDLRAPIRAIAGFAAILAEDHGETLTPEARNCVALIMSRGQHLGNLIDDLLAFCRISREPMTTRTVDMTLMAAAVTEELQTANPARRVDVTLGRLPEARGEPALVRQVLVNLLDNAFKFTGPRETARVEVGALRKDGQTIYFVRDNGVGFDMQYRIGCSASSSGSIRLDEFEGTGVGLAIVQRIVQRHGGRAWAEGVSNEGATFYFTLQAPAPKPAAAS